MVEHNKIIGEDGAISHPRGVALTFGPARAERAPFGMRGTSP